MHRGVEDVARERGVLTLVGSSDEEADRERELADAFMARGVDGLIVATRRARQRLPAARARGRPGAGVRRPSAALHRRRRGRLRQRRRRARRRRAPDRGAATAGSASSATGRTSSRPRSGCAATARRWRATVSLRISSWSGIRCSGGSMRMRPHASCSTARIRPPRCSPVRI